MAKRPEPVISPYHFTTTVSLVCLVLLLVALPVPAIMHTDAIFNYQHSAIANGQIWRLFTGNLLHTNAWHLGMNLAGLWVIVFLHEIHYRYHVGKLILLFCSLCLMEGLGLFNFYPSVSAYVGLSGVLHGLFAFGAVMDIRKGFRSGYLLVLGVIAKVMYEQYFGADAGLSELINARVSIESHLVGMISGFICAIVWWPLAPRFRYKKPLA